MKDSMEVKTVFECSTTPGDFFQVIKNGDGFIFSIVEFETGDVRVVLTRDQLKELKKTIEVLIGEK